MTTARWYVRRGLVMLGVTWLLWAVALTMAQAPSEQTQLLLHLLEYVAVDYPGCVQDGAVLNQEEYDEQEEFSQQIRTLLDQLPAPADTPDLRRQAEQLVALIQDKRPGPEVSTLAHQLRWQVIRVYNVEVAPKRPPDLHTAATLYQAHCAA